MDNGLDHALQAYHEALRAYLQEPDEQALYHASLLSESLAASGLGPDELIGLHSEALTRLLGDEALSPELSHAFRFLLEVMIGYGVYHRAYMTMHLRQATEAATAHVENARASAEAQAQAHAQALREQEEFVSFLAHELRTPLTVIRSGIEGALRALRREKPDQAERMLAHGLQSTTRLQRLTDELLALGREQQQEIERIPLSLGELVDDFWGELELMAHANNIALTREIPQGTLMVLGNAESLTAMLTNLLSNAIKYTPAGGRAWLALHQRDRHIEIEVGDTGIGIPSDALPFIFEKFYRAERRQGIKGTGLGLALVKRVVERHNGAVRVISREREGSIFIVTLPAVPTNLPNLVAERQAPEVPISSDRCHDEPQ